MNRVDRLMGYLLMFQSRGLMRAQDFSAQFEVSERTVYRDIQALSEVGVPIMAMPGEGYRLMEGYYLPPITFAPAEARAIHLAMNMFSSLICEGPTQAAATTALNKIRAALPEATLQQLESLQAVIRFYAFPRHLLDFDDETFITLQEAIDQRKVVRLQYHALHNNRVTSRDIEPLKLDWLDRAWMVSGYCRLRQANRIFRLDRIDQLTLTHERFTPRPVEVCHPEGEIRVTVKFSAEVVRWVREQQHFSFRESQPLPSGETVMRYNVRAFQQIEGWLLSWAGGMEVLEPLELRQRMAALAAAIVSRHG